MYLFGFISDFEDVADFFDQADKDHNKEVTFAEFQEAMAVRNATKV